MGHVKTVARMVNSALILGGLFALTPAFADETCITGNWQADTTATDMPAVKYQSAHFAFRWKDSDAGKVNINSVETAAKRLEEAWDKYVNQIKFPEPYCNSKVKIKANVHLDPSFALTGGLAPNGSMGMWIGTEELKNDWSINWAMPHELAHALQGQTGGFQATAPGSINYMGWFWEAHADWMTHQMDNLHHTQTGSVEEVINMPHLHLGTSRTRYGGWLFLENLKNRYGYKAVNDLWAKAPKEGDPEQGTADPFSVLKSNMNWSQSELNDFFGDWALRNVGWGYTDPDGYNQGEVYRRLLGGYEAFEPNGGNSYRLLRVATLDPISNTAGARRFGVLYEQAPQRWGYNVVRLIADNGASRISVKFNGAVQTVAAVNRFPGLKNDPAALTSPDSDWRWGLVAVNAAGKARYSALQRGASASVNNFSIKKGESIYLVVMGTPTEMHKIKWDQAYYGVYRYPWTVDLTNAWADGSQPNAPTPTANGHRHRNGGGWVAEGAQVDDTAYVGPYAKVLGGKVLGNARVEGHAVVIGGTVSDNARIGGLTVVQGDAVIKGNAQASTTLWPLGLTVPGLVVSGDAQLHGDIDAREANMSVSRGVFYGYLTGAEIRDGQSGANLTDAVPEVTERPAYAK
ncbi:Svx/AvrXca family virulence/avirulence protein [Dickeya chrysanthemi]|uniref:Svx/AvrXca family virulence/avirulence protein n=1 Tax=Dickeya chrysanthemi TaxID=556 RepID=UPI000532E417|nr:Svx/AvrXca family virulence/avirulence protein [Dickeya chrysanthemi]